MAVQAQLYSENLGFPMFASQDWVVNPPPVSASGFCQDHLYNFNNQTQPQQQQQQQQQVPQLHQFQASQQQQQQQQQVPQLHQFQASSQNHLAFDCSSHSQGGGRGPSSSSSTSGDNFLSMAFSQSLAVEIEKQRQEIDLFLQFQNERLRFALQEQRRRQLAVILSNLESKTMSLMRQKDEEIAKATKKTMELQECLSRVEMESQSWQRLAKSNEAMVIHLNNSIEQIREKLILESNGVELDAESSICGSCDITEAKQSSNSSNMACKNCNSQTSCVLFLPCKHLCSCKSCEGLLGFCPVCKSVKEGSFEVFLV